MRGLLLVAALGLAAGAAQAEDLTGTWQFKSKTANPRCALTQTGDFVRGTCEGSGGGGVGFGVVEGQVLRFTYQWTGKDDGSDGAFDFVGRIGPDGSITGDMIGLTAQGRGLFTAVRQTAK